MWLVVWRAAQHRWLAGKVVGNDMMRYQDSDTSFRASELRRSTPDSRLQQMQPCLIPVRSSVAGVAIGRASNRE